MTVTENEVKRLLATHLAWLRDTTRTREYDGFVEITTPYLDRHNDMIQIYVEKTTNGLLKLSDYGHTIQDLEMSGCSLESEKRQKLLTITLNGFGIQRDNDILFCETSEKHFASAKHRLLQAIISIGDLFYVTKEIVKTLFYEDLDTWFEREIDSYTKDISLPGKSHLTHKIDYLIPKSKESDERLIKAMNDPTLQNIEIATFNFYDIRAVRDSPCTPIVIYNDQEKTISQDAQSILSTYDISSIGFVELTRDRELLNV